jgi:Transposase DDE domain
MRSVPNSGDRSRSGFGRILEAFLLQPGLPFARVLSAERIERVFAKHDNQFGGSVYSTAIMVWSFLGQILRDGKEASCQAAVARVAAHQQQTGGAAPTSDTGDFCRARRKLSEDALHELTVEIAAEVQQQADAAWLWKGRQAKLVDGFTFTMPDTPANQAAYPQHTAQKPGIGFPIARVCAVLSLATACILDAAIGPYSGKETGETALLRLLLGSFSPSDLLVADRYYCSFLMIALLRQRGVDVCARLHQRRTADFRRGRRLGPDDHLITWTKPPRPEWMDEPTYATIPDTLTLREMRYCVVIPGRRVQVLTVVTTLLDAETYSREDIAELYGFRWNSELDIRAIKQSLNLAHVRCKSPAMVRRELWTTLLAYNLIRTTAAAAAMLHDKQPRHISFTGACQYVLASWSLFAAHRIPAADLDAHCRTLLAHIATCQVANRPGRIEPRELKRRRHGYKLMQEPRNTLRARLTKRN